VKQLTIFSVKKRIKTLEEFKVLVIKYFKSRKSHIGEVYETEESLKYRSEINLLVSKIEQYVFDADISDEYFYTPPPVVGGYAHRLKLLPNIFNLTAFQISLHQVTDILERASAQYQDDITHAKIRTFNPFFWFWLIILKISSIPFALLSSAGFDGDKVRNSFVGKILKLIIESVAVTSGLVTILSGLGIMEKLISVLKRVGN